MKTANLFAILMAALVANSLSARAEMYVSSLPNSIFYITSGGVVNPFATLPAGSNPYGLAVDASGTVLATRNPTRRLSISGGYQGLKPICMAPKLTGSVIPR